MNARRRRIEDGLENAKRMDKKLAEVEVLRVEEIKKGEREALRIIEDAKKDGQAERSAIVSAAEVEAEQAKKKAEDLSRRLMLREMEKIDADAKALIEQVVAAAIGMNPETIDKKLVADAVQIIKQVKV
jgi:F-type H+-transporting ATPase subunit b